MGLTGNIRKSNIPVTTKQFAIEEDGNFRDVEAASDDQRRHEVVHTVTARHEDRDLSWTE